VVVRSSRRVVPWVENRDDPRAEKRVAGEETGRASSWSLGGRRVYFTALPGVWRLGDLGGKVGQLWDWGGFLWEDDDAAQLRSGSLASAATEGGWPKSKVHIVSRRSGGLGFLSIVIIHAEHLPVVTSQGSGSTESGSWLSCAVLLSCGDVCGAMRSQATPSPTLPGSQSGAVVSRPAAARTWQRLSGRLAGCFRAQHTHGQARPVAARPKQRAKSPDVALLLPHTTARQPPPFSWAPAPISLPHCGRTRRLLPRSSLAGIDCGL